MLAAVSMVAARGVCGMRHDGRFAVALTVIALTVVALAGACSSNTKPATAVTPPGSEKAPTAKPIAATMGAALSLVVGTGSCDEQ